MTKKPTTESVWRLWDPEAGEWYRSKRGGARGRTFWVSPAAAATAKRAGGVVNNEILEIVECKVTPVEEEDEDYGFQDR